MLTELKAKEKFRIRKRTEESQKRANCVTEEITSKDQNNLYITSSFFKDSIKYKAFCAYYAVMRIVDDRVDNLRLPVNRDKKLIDRELKVIDAWEQVIILCHLGIFPTALNFFDAMRSDINAGEFECWSDFLTYAEGATVAPTTIYLLLIAARYNSANNVYELPTGFDLLRCGRYLGIFAYLGHIIRDLAEDIKYTTTRLCITREDMVEHNVTLEKLRNEAIKQNASSSTRKLVIEIIQRARNYLFKGRALTLQIQDFLELDCRFILELIVRMYERIIAKIESSDFNPMGKQHYLTRREKINLVYSVAADTGFSLPKWVSI
ncbi:MAG: squalene/phytoene synthase family protein [Ignavibacteriaceae bacterium]